MSARVTWKHAGGSSRGVVGDLTLTVGACPQAYRGWRYTIRRAGHQLWAREYIGSLDAAKRAASEKAREMLAARKAATTRGEEG